MVMVECRVSKGDDYEGLVKEQKAIKMIWRGYC